MSFSRGMKHFYATMYGDNKNPSTGGATKDNGMTIHAMSVSGNIEVTMYHCVAYDCDCVRIEFAKHPTMGTGGVGVIYEGPIDPDKYDDAGHTRLSDCLGAWLTEEVRNTCTPPPTKEDTLAASIRTMRDIIGHEESDTYTDIPQQDTPNTTEGDS